MNNRFGTIMSNLGCLCVVAGVYVSAGFGSGLLTLGVYLFILGASKQDIERFNPGGDDDD